MQEGELFNPQDYGNNKNYNHKEDPYFREKIGHEIHRIMGLLRFSPNEEGVFVARCASDYYILPALGPYFTGRFGNTPWEIIDEKRGLSLSRKNEGKPKLTKIEGTLPEEKKSIGCHEAPVLIDEWEELWKHYHKIINNESRDNPSLQRQFMPQRYWKYLPEKE